MAASLVSVLIPCYNAERTIGETLESVLGQTWPNIEVIVTDDGSADNSVTVVEKMRSHKIRLKRQSNRGQTAALNACLRLAQGEFIQYLDADDLISSNKIETQMRRLAGRENCVASAAWGRFRTSPKETQFLEEVVWRDLDPLDWLAGSRASGLGMMFPALWLIPNGLIKRIGPWREDLTLNNDAEYFTRLLLAARRVLFCPDAQCYYRSGHATSLSATKTAAAWSSQFKVLDLCEGYVLARENSERMRRAFSLSWQHMAHGCYPYAPDLAESALRRAARLHEIRIRPDGGSMFRIASRLLGWRLARRLQVASGRS